MLAASVETRPTLDAPRSAAVEVMLHLAALRSAGNGGATGADMARDLGPYFSHRLSPSEFRETLSQARQDLLDEGLATASRGRYQLTDAGRLSVATWLGARGLPGDWSELRDTHLMARALGQIDMPATRRNMLSRPDGLRMAIVQKAYGLRLRRVPTPARVRAALAGIALKRAFGNKLGPDFSVDGGVDANASRVLAGQLARRPQDFGTDSRLIGALAAEAIGAAQSDINTLRLVLVRQLVSEALGASPAALPTPAPPAATERPDLETFAHAVLGAADGCAQGWPGNRKAFISSVWDAVREAQSQWALTEIEFKSMLVEAHRSGLVVLANADLKPKADLADFQRSAITYKNTVWHFIRLET